MNQTGQIISAGYPLRYPLWSSDVPRATLVVLHGVMSHSAWLKGLAEPLARQGLHVVGADRRGSGLNTLAREDATSASVLIADLERIIEQEHQPGRPLFILGWCWGAVLALGAMRVLSDRVDGLILAAPGFFPSASVRKSLDEQVRLMATQPEDSPCLSSPIREEMFTEGPWLQNYILRDDLRWRHFTPRFHRVMKELGLCAAVELRRLTKPALLILADKDLAVENEQTLAAFAKVPAPVTIRRINCHHGIQFEAPDQLFEAVSAWIENYFAGKSGA